MSADRQEHETRDPIFEAVLDALESNDGLKFEPLLERFPNQREEIEQALDAVGRYQHCALVAREELDGSTPGCLLLPGSPLGDYTIDSLIGKGGMGEVYRARSRSTKGPPVALKVLPPALVARDPRFVQRFRREARLASEVHHPGVAEVYGSGNEDGLLYFAMRLVEGRTLADVMSCIARSRSMGLQLMDSAARCRKAVALVRDLAQAVGTIHARALVHRDIKPSNVILEHAPEDDLLALGCTPVLVDFGLLRPVTGSEITGHDTILGTPAFSSPEAQLQRSVGPQSDVFSLGAVLYDLLAQTTGGERPAASSGLNDVRALNPAVDRRLAAIVRMALEESPALRYRNGSVFAEELENYLQGATLAALPSRSWRRVRLWVRRNPSRALRRGTFLLATLVTLMALGAWNNRAWEFHELAHSAQLAAESGDLVTAAKHYRELDRKARGLRFLTGIQADLERAREFWPEGGGSSSLGRGQALMSIGGSIEERHRGHVWLQRALRADGEESEREAIFSFLAREVADTTLADDRRQAAAESAAHHFLLFPTGRDGSSPPSSALDRLQRSLVALLSEETEPMLSRTLAASALGGLRSEDSFEALVRVLSLSRADSPGAEELIRVALVGTDRIWWQYREEGRLEELPQHLVVTWFESIHRQLVKGTERRGAFNPTMPEQQLYAAAFTHVLLQERGMLDDAVWDELDPDSRPLLDDIERIFVACRAGQDPPRQCVGPFRAARCFRAPTPAERMAYYTRVWRDPASRWRGFSDLFDLEGESPELDVYEQARQHIAVHFEGGQVRTRKDVLGIQGEHLRLVPHGAEQVLQFDRLQKSVLRVRCRIPAGSPAAHVTLDGAKAARFMLPHAGRARIQLSITGGRMLLDAEPALGRTPLEYWIPRDDLVRMDELDIEIRLLEGTTTYWLYGLDIEFTAIPGLGGDGPGPPR